MGRKIQHHLVGKIDHKLGVKKNFFEILYLLLLIVMMKPLTRSKRGRTYFCSKFEGLIHHRRGNMAAGEQDT